MAFGLTWQLSQVRAGIVFECGCNGARVGALNPSIVLLILLYTLTLPSSSTYVNTTWQPGTTGDTFPFRFIPSMGSSHRIKLLFSSLFPDDTVSCCWPVNGSRFFADNNQSV